MKEAFIDSGAFIAFLNTSDRLHEEADALFSAPPRRLLTSALVVAETYGWMLHRLGGDSARMFRALLGSIPALEILAIDQAHLEAAGAKRHAVA